MFRVSLPGSALLLSAALIGASPTVEAQTAATPGVNTTSDAARRDQTVPGKPAAPAASAPKKIGGLTITGSSRARFEAWDWFDAPGFDDRYNFGAVLSRVGVGQQRERVDWQVEGAFPLLLNLPDHAIAPAPQGQLGLGAAYSAANGGLNASAFLKEAFVRFKGIGGDRSSSVRFGRFDFADGAEVTPRDSTLAALKREHVAHRLISNFGFSHVQRSFDGVHYARQTPRNNFTFVAARPTEGVFQLRGMKELDVDVSYGSFTRQMSYKQTESEARVFALYYHDGRSTLKVDNRPSAVRTVDQQNIRLTTLGGHHLSTFTARGGKVDLLLWGVGQVGEWGALSHRASALAAEAGYQPNLKLKPWFRAGYFRGSGDGDAADRRHGTFFQVLPTPRLFARFPFYNLMNNEDTFAQITLRPHARVTLRTDVHHLQLSNANDLWYSGGGAFQDTTFGYAGRPSNGDTNLATMLDVSVDYEHSRMSSFTLYLASALGQGVASRIYPARDRARLTYLEFMRRF